MFAAGLTGLTKSTQLTSLNLALCREISDAGVASVAALPRLQTLDMTFCDRITDASIYHLCRCDITISAFIAAATHLACMLHIVRKASHC